MSEGQTMARKRRSQTQLYQAKARAKEQRIRRKLRNQLGSEEGAYAWGSVQVVSPVRPWSEVRKFTPGEKRSYLASLKRFVGQHDLGAIISMGYSATAQGAVRQYNMAAMARRERISAIPVKWSKKGAKEYIRRTVDDQMREQYSIQIDPATGKATGEVFRMVGYNLRGMMPMSERMEPPRNERAARQRADNLRRMAETTDAEILARTKANAISMCETAGFDDLADLLRNMSDTQLEVLFNRTDFMGELDVATAPYYKEELYKAYKRGDMTREEWLDAARASVTEDEKTSAQDVPSVIAQKVAESVV